MAMEIRLWPSFGLQANQDVARGEPSVCNTTPLRAMVFQKLPAGPDPIRLGHDEAICPRSQSLTEAVWLAGNHAVGRSFPRADAFSAFRPADWKLLSVNGTYEATNDLS